LLQAEPRENRGSDSGLQDPRELQKEFGNLEGTAGGFKILVFCRPGDRDAEKKKEQNNTRATCILRCGGQLH